MYKTISYNYKQKSYYEAVKMMISWSLVAEHSYMNFTFYYTL